MPLKFKFSLLVLLLCFMQPCVAQEKKPQTVRDSAAMYKKIEKYSKRSKFFKMMHKMVFEPTEVKKSNPIRKPKKKKYKSYEGKIVRKINVQTLDPFGYSEIDTTKKPRNWAERSGNRLHIKSTQLAIRNLLLIRKNRPLDTLLVSESERLIRTQRYVSRVVIDAKPVGRDSVDVYVRVLDSWSLIPRGSISSSRTTAELDERNIFGSGHQFDAKYSRRREDKTNLYDFKYVIPTIKNSFVRTTLGYKFDFDGNYSKSLNIERTFFSPFTKWAGGFYMNQAISKGFVARA
ncbi:hypothetical protein [Flavobacterium sp. 3HN19-14]|uniref:hypothetical protein n=1 Tax=Flavobacterium sp. 3HN19-14 TaxID=3448133 RepID=UPI003EE17EE1